MTAQDFLKKYNLKVTFEQMYLIQNKMNRMSNFTFKDGAVSFDKKNYLSGLRYMLSAYMADKVQPQEFKHVVSFEDFNFVQFLKDYESAMQDEFEKSGSTRDRKPFENVGIRALDVVKTQMLSFNKPVVKIWADLIKKGAHIDNLRAATIGVLQEEERRKAQGNAKSEEELTKTKEVNANELLNPEKSNEPRIEAQAPKINAAEASNEITTKGVNSLTIAFGMYKAMERVIERRTWGWRLNPFNWSRWREENRFMSELKEKLKPHMFDPQETDQLTKDSLLSTSKCYYFDEFTLNVRNGKIELTADNKELTELNEVVNELDKDESFIDNDIADIDVNEIDADTEEIKSDFENLKSDIAFFNEEDPNLYIAPKESNDIFLAEDSVLDAEDIKPAHEDKYRNPNNIIGEDDVIPEPNENELRKQFMEMEKRGKKIIEEKEIQMKYEKLLSCPKPQSVQGALELLKNKEISSTILQVCTIPLANSGKVEMDNLLTVNTIQKSLNKEIERLWNAPEKMQQNVMNTFKYVYNVIKENTPKMNIAEKLVAAQKITDIVLNTYSPVGAKAEYAQYSKSFCVQNMNANDVQELTGYEESFDKLMTDVKVGLGIVEKVKFSGDVFDEKMSDKSNKIEEHDAPAVGKITK